MKEIKLVLGIAVIVLIVLAVIAAPWLWIIVLAVVGIGSIIWAILRSFGRSTRILVRPKTEAEKEYRSGIGWAIGLPLAIIGGIIVIAFIGMAVYDFMTPADKQSGQSQSANASTQSNPVQPAPTTLDPQPAANSGVPMASVPEALKSTAPPVQSRPMVAQGVSFVPGALICRDHDTVSLMFDLYNNAWADKYQDAVTKGQSELLRGRAANAPDPTEYNCVLLPPGTPMMLEPGNIVPVVRVQTTDGWIRGVTLDAMMISQAKASAQAAATAAAEQFVESIEALKPDFQSQFPTLRAPAPNLRWYSTADQSVLVLPYGPCVVIRAVNGGFSYTAINSNSVRFFGPYQTQEDAEKDAARNCSAQYDPQKSSGKIDLWFPPDGPQDAGSQEQ